MLARAARRGRRRRGRRPAALMAMGVLVERLSEDERAARGEFAERFAAFAAKAQRQLVKETFAMSQVLATYNIKGGVGKTSAAVNLAYLAARDGLRTLLWDLDPQGGSTYLFRVKPKIRGGGRKLVRLKSDVADADQGDRPRAASTCCPPISPTATWISRSTASSTRRGGWRGCSSRCAASTTTCSSTARRASRWSPRACSRPPTRCSSRSSRRRCPRARSSQLDAVVADARERAGQVLAFFSMVDVGASSFTAR